MEELTDRQFGAYRVISALGQGGMAAIYKAFQPAVNRYIALKILSRHFTSDPEFFQRFRHEAAILAQLQHPHILPVFDFGEADGYAFLAMPFMDAGTLAGLMKGRPVALDVIERVMSQVGDALDYAHSKGIVHRDIKPSNILMDERGNCLVADFGIARMAEGATHLTMTGTVMGTPEYMSPEQAMGETAGPASDIYSLGIVLYEMLTGRVPFRAETPIAVAVKHVNAPLPPPRTVNPALTPDVEAVVVRALARSPADRFPSSSVLAAALAAAIHTGRETRPMETVPSHDPGSTVLLERRPVSSRLEAKDETPTELAATVLKPSIRQSVRPRRTVKYAGVVAAAVALFALVAGLLLRTGTASRDSAVGGDTLVAPQPPPAELTRPVNDFAGVIDPESAQQIESLIRSLQETTGDVVVVATIHTFRPWSNIREYAMKMFENHGRGTGQRGKDNGLLVLLAIQDREARIEVGHGLVQFITDDIADETMRQEMTPHFSRGNYGAGVLAGVSRIIARIAEGRNVSLRGVP